MNTGYQVLRFLDSKIIFVLTFFSLHSLFMFGQGQCSAVAPDEITYLEVFKDLYYDVPNQRLVEVYGSSKFIYYIYFFPGFLFDLAFNNALFSIRFSSIFFTFIIYLISDKIISNAQVANPIWLRRIFKLSFLVIPSVFIFTSAGIRESLLIFSLVLTFFGLNLIFQNSFKFGAPLYAAGFLISISTKIYLYPILALAGLLVMIAIRKNQIRNIFLVLATSLMSLIMFWQPIAHVLFNVEYERSPINSITMDSNVNNFEDSLLEPKKVLESKTPIPASQDPRQIFESEVPRATSLWLNFCLEQNTLGFLKGPIKEIFWNEGLIPAVDLSNQDSGREPEASGDGQAEFGKSPFTSGDGQAEFGKSPAAVLYQFYETRKVLPIQQLPMNVLRFVSNPISDLSSRYLAIFLIELPFWILSLSILFVSIFGFRRFRFEWNWLTIYSGMVFLLFLLYSGATEVNVGTSIRHRIFLWLPLIFLLSGIRKVPSPGSKEPLVNKTNNPRYY